MENLVTIPNIISLLIFISYLVIFTIQKSQLKKQKELLESYSRIFDFIKIDEIEKYVHLQKKSNELSLSNKRIELNEFEKELKAKHQEIGTILNSSKLNLSEIESLKNELNPIFEKNLKLLEENKSSIERVTKLFMKEFEEIHNLLRTKLSNQAEKKLFTEIDNELLNIAKKYDRIKRKELKL